MHDPNGIIDARAASPLAPDLVTAMSDEGLWNLASSLSSPCNQKYTMRSDILILDRIVSRFGTHQKVSFKDCFSYEYACVMTSCHTHATHMSHMCHTHEALLDKSCHTSKSLVHHVHASCHAHDMSHTHDVTSHM